MPQDREEYTEQYPYKLGLALSGGGAKGFAHLGVLKAMDELGIRPDIISGTSAGAFAGVLYADGYSPDEIISFFKKKSFKEFAELTIPHTGIFKTDRFKRFLKTHLKAKTFDDLHIPMKIIATDLANGTSVAFDEGPLIPAVIASCAFPIIFTPAEINNVYYVDGGLFKNFPVTPIRFDCETVIGVNVAPLTKQEFKNSLLYVAERSFHYMSVSNSFADRNLCDILLETEALSQYAMFTLEHTEEIVNIGYEFAKKEFAKPGNLAIINKISPINKNQAI
ncbi:patatin-like phospholipase family protein [Dysgonomonas macrotermitis]|uniref:NTE family protein n=1 Tax=Dysgonomonas macrotermitis TaxID=1346286 RepID=A0A1M5CZJ6_9BACT|nr:patatin-like phospholipase family protein [Dysgonomonas macrotermitis]SHF60055.1 NTE family protein [Dysgonomonas macrotermitis]